MCDVTTVYTGHVMGGVLGGGGCITVSWSAKEIKSTPLADLL